MVLLTAGMAQEEICEPRAAEVLGARLDDATASLAAADMTEARAQLELARDDARCLEVVIPPPLLARLAHLHAEHAVYEQDLETTWRWLRLAELVAPDGPLPPHLSEAHPLRRFNAEQPSAPPIEGIDRGIAHPRKGGVYLDGARMERAEAMSETPHLVQMFTNKELTGAWWQVGPRFDPAVLTVDAPEAEVIGPKRWKPAKRDTIAAWEKWIRANPDSEWAPEARGRLDDRRFTGAERDGPPGLRAYLDDSPGRNARAARAALEKTDFDATAAKNTRQGWQLYLGRHPKGVFLPEALQHLDVLMWAHTLEQDDEPAYARYLIQMRQGSHRDEARVALAARVFESALASGDPRSLQKYLSRFPLGADADRARAEMRGTHFDAVAIAVVGPAPQGFALGLAEAVESYGLRAEILADPGTFHDATRKTLGNGLLWVEITAVDDESSRAVVSLWCDRSPVREWTVQAANPDILAYTRGRMPNLSAFSTSAP